MSESEALMDEVLRLRSLLREARAAIEPLTGAQIKLHRIKLDLADRIDAALGVVEAPAPQREQRDVPPGKWKVDMPDGSYLSMPGDPPGPSSLRAVIGGYVYDVEPHTGRLIATEPPTGFRLQKFNDDMQRRNPGVGEPLEGRDG